MELKESIDYLKNCLDDKWDFKNATREKDKQAIDTVLEELNRLQKEVKEYEEDIENEKKCLEDIK